MEIELNGVKTELEDNVKVSEMLERLNYKKSKAAVWVNNRQLLFSEYDQCVVSNGSIVKVIRILGGG